MLAAVLAAIVLGLVGLRDRRPRLFQYLPVPFWCYVLPMIGGTFRLFPEASPVYPLLGRYALPFCLSLLLINVDLRALVRLGRPAVLAMGLGVAGIGMGAVLGLFLFHGNLPPGAWKAVGALSASWTGGSANMLAVKEALSAPEAVFAPVVVIDSFFAYAWMAGLISLAGFQESFDRWVGAVTVGATPPAGRGPTYHVPWPGVPAAAAVLALVALVVGDRAGPALTAAVATVAPGWAATLSPSTWTVLTVTTLTLAVSLTGGFRATPERTERWGTTVLYVLLASLGARASLAALGRAPYFLAVGACILAVHAVILWAGGRLFRLPLFLLASASQACVGGVVSAPMVSAVYRPALSAVGLLLAVTGNVVGTYFGLVVAQISSRWG